MLHIVYFSIILSVFCVQSCGASIFGVPPVPNVNSRNAQTPSRIRKRHFSREEDNRLYELVTIYGTRSWKLIADGMGNGRAPRRYRERWYNYLSPHVEKREWTSEEEERLISLVQEWGPKWTKIGRELQRTENDVKNRNQTILHRRDKIVQQQEPDQYQYQYQDQDQYQDQYQDQDQYQ